MTMAVQPAQERSWSPPRLRAVVGRVPNIITRKNAFLNRLADGIRRARLRMEPHLKVRRACIDALVGPRYGDAKSKRGQPLPTITSYVGIMQPLIVPQRIACEVNTPDAELRWKARKLAAIINRTIEEVDVLSGVSAAVIDALFGWGIVKVGLESVVPGGIEDFENWRQDPGRFFAGRVSPTQFVFDDTCTDFAAAKWQGHSEWVEDVVAFEEYPDAKDTLEKMGTDKRRTRESEGQGTDPEALYPEYELLHVHLKREGVILTIPAVPDKVGLQPLRERKYKGPEGGEYYMLGFMRPPDSPFPINVVDQTLDMHEAVNATMRKMVQQVNRLKRILLYKTGKEVEATRVAKIGDGGTAGVEDPKQFAEVQLGGVAAELGQILGTLQSLMNYFSGNPEAVGGLASRAGTLGQQTLEYQNATTSLGRMRTATMAMAQWISRSASWYVITNPSPDPVDIMVPVEGEPEGMADQWTALDRGTLQVDYEHLAIEVNAYAATAVGPEGEYQATRELLTEVIVPLLPMSAAQGVQLDMAAVISRLSRLRGLREFDDWFKAATPMLLPGAPSVARRTGTPSEARRTGKASEPAAAVGGEPSMRMTPSEASFGE